MRLVTLNEVLVGGWIIKASSLDDQILIIGLNKSSAESFLKMFYDEESAFIFMESLNDQTDQACNW